MRPALLSRREWIKSLLLLPAALGLARVARAQASGKVSKTVAQYQDKPKDDKMCGMCKHYIAPGGKPGGGMMGDQRGPGMMAQVGTCQLVEGSISPWGWCMLYAPIGS